MGILSFLFGRKKSAHHESSPSEVSSDETTPLESGSVISELALDNDIAALHRRATEFKDAKQWEEAIACLRKAKELIGPSMGGYTVQRLCRLPLFLQQAGHFEEALIEFQVLLDNAEAANQEEFGHQRKNVQEKFLHLRLSQIYGHMITACKRQKRLDLLEIYQEKARFHYGKFTRMKAAQEAAEKRKR
ncbi:MAG: hypothetical protein IJD16_04440 [Desulfovibrio sp.]|nr:hypothetical protein [Desulfovibrio sp.]